MLSPSVCRENSQQEHRISLARECAHLSVYVRLITLLCSLKMSIIVVSRYLHMIHMHDVQVPYSSIVHRSFSL